MAKERRPIISRSNYEELSRLLLHSTDDRANELLEMELDRADLVPDDRVPSDVVTMNSRVLFEDEATGVRREVELVFPRDAAWDKGRISVLAPVGAALLGLSVADTIDFPMPGGRRRLRVVAVLFQPEAAAGPFLPPVA